ncbi:MFS transporter [Falsiroseomonas sp.]|uniref:MFS transporter n=1 Tax=Falsiroseomonas sp. TaxID=2870721 RepID=UPI00356AE742
MAGGLHGLAAALMATTLAQVLATMAVYGLPVLAPMAARDLGVGAEMVGTQVAIVYAAASVTSMAFGRLPARLGPARCTQLALGAGAAGAAAVALGGLPGVAAGSVLLGVAYGLTSPPATLVLSRLAPPARRNMVFSIKQMGVPVGGTLAGLLLPSAALLLGWHGALATVAVVLAAAALGLGVFRRPWDAARDAAPEAGAQLGALAALRSGRGLMALAVMGASFSAVQLSLGAFAVTMLVQEFGWGAVAAGAAAAAVQASGAAARLLWAVLADRARSGLALLAAIGLGTAAAALAMPLALHWPAAAVLLLLCLFGACAAGWTGIAMAEVARRAPPGAAGAATGGVLSVTFTGVVLGPLIFAAAVSLLGSYATAFALIAALPLAGAAVAWGAHRRTG